jgi:hypothetical protein
VKVFRVGLQAKGGHFQNKEYFLSIILS